MQPFQFRLSSLFIFVAIVCTIMAWVKWRCSYKAIERAAKDEITKIGGRVWYDWQLATDSGQTKTPFGPKRIRRILGDDAFSTVTKVVVSDHYLDDNLIRHVQSLTAVEELGLNATGLTDSGLARLKGLSRLRELSLARSKITDAGLVSLESFTQLRSLRLDGTAITDNGLVHVAKLLGLEALQLQDTAVTDLGMHQIAKLTRLRKLRIARTDLTDGAVVDLQRLTCLEVLDLRGTSVTEKGMSQLKTLIHLELLYVDDCTTEGVRELQDALPGCFIPE